MVTLRDGPHYSQQPDAPHIFMALALPFLQAMLKVFLLPHVPLLNFMRALAYGYAIAGVTLLAIFAAWLLPDESHHFKAAVPAMCTRMHLKAVRPVAQRRCCACSQRARSLLAPRCVPVALTGRLQGSMCLGAVFAWASPALAGGWSIILGALSYFISRSPEETGRAAAAKLLPVAVRAALSCCTCPSHHHLC